MNAPDGSRQRRSAVAVLAVAAVVVAIAFVVFRDSGGDDDRSIDGGPPHVLLDPVPDELTLTNAFTGPADVTIFDTGTVVVYADATAADPLGGSVLLSTTVHQEGAEPASGDPVTIQGSTGTRYASPGRDGLVVSWLTGPDRLQILTAIGLPEADLLRAAEGVVGVDGEIDPADLPEGFAEVGRDSFTALTVFGRGFMLDGQGSGTLVYSDLKLGTELVISSGDGGPERVALLRPFLDDLRNVDVGGTLAVAGTAEGSPAISWMLGETVVRVTGLGYTLDDLIDIVQDIRPSTDDEFTSIVGEFIATN